jgi:hypothetical protein
LTLDFPSPQCITLIMFLPLALLALTTKSLKSVRVKIDPRRILDSFIPNQTFGGALDGQDQGDVLSKLTPYNLAAMISTGLKPLDYRVRTELGDEAWHWNPQGSWSDPIHHQGYWTSDSVPGKPIRLCWGYRLPHRGNTTDQANDDGYSRIDDGDPSTYWKSNPYLDPHFTHEKEQSHPQWIVADFQKLELINAARIDWGLPFATRFDLQYWDGDAHAQPEDSPDGRWRSFPVGIVSQSKANRGVLKLGTTERTRYVRLLLLNSSHTSEPEESGDLRGRLGFAVRELQVGVVQSGGFRDRIDHHHSHDQTEIYTSSTDPWHRATDRDVTTEQPGFDFVRRSGLTHGLPMLVPVGLLYDNPDNAAAEIVWLKRRGIPLSGVELGEEPDGQETTAEDFAALYLQTAKRIRAIDATVKLGGPSFASIDPSRADWCEVEADKSWLRLFLEALNRYRGRDLFQFFSFEWYPFDKSYLPTEPQLRVAMPKLTSYIKWARDQGIPTQIPWFITEYGYSAFAGPADTSVASAILNLDSVGTFLSLGGKTTYLYGYEPNETICEDPGSWGNLMTWLIDDDGNARYPMPTDWAARLMTMDWCEPIQKDHSMLQTTNSDPQLVGSYSVKRPDGTIAVLLTNRDSTRGRSVSIFIGNRRVVGGEATQWGRKEYSWANVREDTHPSKSLPPTHEHFSGTLRLAPYTAAVIVLRA